MDLYQQQPIDLDRPAIRLLQLLKGKLTESIRCNLLTGWFDEPESIIPYSALSYTWGGTNKSCEITVDNTTINVTANLYSALMHLRLEDKDRILWIDAICINQDNVQEKIHQICQMDAIYRAAEEVIVWLGNGTKETDFIMNSMVLLQEFCLNHPADWRGAAKVWLQYQQSLTREYHQRSRIGIRELLGRPWFRRIWIVQEIANARLATVYCGRFSVSTRIFAQFPVLVRTISNYCSVPLEVPGHCQSVLDIMPGLSRKESWWGGGRELHTLLVKFRKSEATDDRDMIYALLNISSDARGSDILNPKCDKPLQQVIHETVSFIIHEKYSHSTYSKNDASLYEFLDWTLSTFLDNLEELNSVILGAASEAGKGHLVKLLLATDGIKVDFQDDHGRTPLQRAFCGGHRVIVRLLIEEITQANNFKYRECNQGLFWAVGSGDEGAVRLLLERGASIETRTGYDRTALSLAVLYGKTTIVKLLIENGADIEARDLEGQTPLSLAARNGEMDIVNLLLRKGAKPEAKDKTGIIRVLQVWNVCMFSAFTFTFSILRIFLIVARSCLHMVPGILGFYFLSGRFGLFRMYRIFGIFGVFQIFLPFVIFQFRESFASIFLRRRNRTGF
ncbi:6927b832-dcdc-49a2-bc78-ac94e166f114-CDS [Sclerotinia trifoliorum]|uniref:6927b832-dcdc-49a2-bc78-ac94e166f114-CDS n=1 Tax=Sclerotinia trifoliorum TaxID=28548 RepID=A0A8H2VMV4_9HELO|nr:6927b832-dcdc-49a2-bc78-ac94e166f114-CDS [Sclerotinia trifoliorum]